jgi:hypothetical protein
MATGLLNARDWIFEAETATPGTYVEIGALDNWTLNPGENEEVSDNTVFEDAGNYSSEPMQRGATIELTAKMRATSGTPDAGQLRIDTLGAAIGSAALFEFRFRHTAQTTWTVWASAWVSLGERGGGANEKTAWACTITRDGAASTAAVE